MAVCRLHLQTAAGGGRYFDPLLGIWLALTPLLVVQSWRGRKRKRGGAWHLLLVLLVVGVGSTLTGCVSPTPGGDTPTPTACATPTPTGMRGGTPVPFGTQGPMPTGTTPQPTSTTPAPTATDTPTPTPTPTIGPEPVLPDPEYVIRTTNNYSDQERMLARMIWNEQRGQGSDALRAAAWVAKNRVGKPSQVTGITLGTLNDVLTEPKQFKYPGGDPVETVKDKWPGDPDKVNWFNALDTARGVLGNDDKYQDNTHGSRFFVNYNEELKRNWDLDSEQELQDRFENYETTRPDFWWGHYSSMYIFNQFDALKPPVQSTTP